MNVTVVSPGGAGFITVFPGGATRPTASNLNYSAGQAPVPNLVGAALGSTGQLSFYGSVGPVDIVADITAYTVGSRMSRDDALQGRWKNDRGKKLQSAGGATCGTLGHVAFDGSDVWATDSGCDEVLHWDSTTLALKGRVAVGAGPAGMAFDGRYLWVANSASNTVSRIDTRTGTKVPGDLPTGSRPTEVLYDGTRIWIANSSANTLTRYDAATGTRITPDVSVGTSPTNMVLAEGYVWVVNSGGTTVSRVAALNGVRLADVTVGSFPSHIAYDGDLIWVARNAQSTLSTFSPLAPVSVRNISVTGGSNVNPGYGFAYDGESVIFYDNAIGWRKIDVASETVSTLNNLPPDDVGELRFDGTDLWAVSNVLVRKLPG